MKNIVVLLISIVLVSCGGGGSDTPPAPKENRAPSIPALTNPANGLLCINNIVDFIWTSSVDPDGDNITYELVIAKDSQFTQIIQTKSTAALTLNITLDKGTPYYWKVKAVDSKSKASDFTGTWGFYTEGVGVVNYVPFAAGLVKPALNGIVPTTTVLEWTASDLDNDPLTYDIYLGTSANPPSVATNHASKTYNATGLLPNTTYFWRIDVKDNKNGKTTGQVWSFKTS